MEESGSVLGVPLSIALCHKPLVSCSLPVLDTITLVDSRALSTLVHTYLDGKCCVDMGGDN